jgi:hypothetical protein
MRRHVLWLDDYFYDAGELFPPDADMEIQSDLQRIKKQFPNTSFHPRTTLSGFVQQIVDHERIVRRMEPKNKGACKLDAIVVDIMIDQTDQTPIPLLDETDARILFRPGGGVEKYVPLKFNESGSDAGLVITEHFLRKLDSLRETAIVFYTHKPISDQMQSIARRMNNSKLIHGLEKFKGIQQMFKIFKDLGLQ